MFARKIAFFVMACALLFGTGNALAVEKEGTFALGFNNSDAPVGVRYFFNEQVGIDLGLGLESTDLGSESATSFFLEGGLTYVAFDFDNSFFFVRPAVAFSSLDDRAYGSGTVDDSWTVIDLSLNLGAEVRLAQRFGLTFQHGLMLSMTSVPTDVANAQYGGEDSFTDFSTFGENVTEAGVWFTF